jgi:hypothetical protein
MNCDQGTPMIDKIKIGSKARQKIMVCLFAVVAALGFMQVDGLAAFESAPAIGGEKISPEIRKKIEFAATQHDLILLLIQTKDFSSVESEWKMVLDLKLGAEYENLVAQSLRIITEKLLEAKQFPLALQLLDASLSMAPFSNGNKADIYRHKAALYKETGDLDSAIKAMKQSQEFRITP